MVDGPSTFCNVSGAHSYRHTRMTRICLHDSELEGPLQENHLGAIYVLAE